MGAHLGQHFLTARWAAVALVHAANIKKDDTVLEIGPGKGFLTNELLRTGARVIAIEKDSSLVARLHEQYADAISAKQLVVIESDVRSITPDSLGLSAGAYILAANIPYYITGEIIRRFLTEEHHPRTMALLVQKEIAERIATKSKESVLSISVKAYGVPKKEHVVSRTCFSPVPNVDSAILTVSDISHDRLDSIDHEHFFSIVKAGFAQKRKQIAGNLSVTYSPAEVKAALNACGIDRTVRAEDVHLAAWACLARTLPPQ